jgi:hypothetical protein
MAKTVKSVKNSLKFKAQPKPGILSVRVGVKKYAVPVEARIISSGNYIFLSFPASSELYQVQSKELSAMDANADAGEAYTALNPGKRRGRKRSAAASLPPELAEALKGIPAGYKLGYGTDGVPRLVKKRKRGGKE